MKYATGNRINFIQFESQFSYEMEKFLSEYAGINPSKYHKALSIILQIHMRAGNTGGYFLSADPDDIMDDARKFNIGISELKAIYDVATKRGVFDRDQYEKNHIITNEALQIAFCKAKEGRNGHSMDKSHILNSVYKKFKSEDKNKKIADKLEKFMGINQSIESNGKELNCIESNIFYTIFWHFAIGICHILQFFSKFFVRCHEVTLALMHKRCKPAQTAVPFRCAGCAGQARSCKSRTQRRARPPARKSPLHCQPPRRSLRRA